MYISTNDSCFFVLTNNTDPDESRHYHKYLQCLQKKPITDFQLTVGLKMTMYTIFQVHVYNFSSSCVQFSSSCI